VLAYETGLVTPGGTGPALTNPDISPSSYRQPSAVTRRPFSQPVAFTL
jgi:hypothetical protein